MDKKNLRGQMHNSMYHQIQKQGYATSVDVLQDIDILKKEDYESWRFGRVPYLEQVCGGNLHLLSDIIKEMRKYAAKNNLKPSWTCYHGWGRNKQSKLRFSKSSKESIEQSYATHYITNSMLYSDNV